MPALHELQADVLRAVLGRTNRAADHVAAGAIDAQRRLGIYRNNFRQGLTDALAAVYPAIVRLWENAWSEFVPFLNFDTEIRTVICSTNAIESVNARIRRAVKARGHFPSEQAALKCVYMAIMSLDPTGKGRKRWTMRWKAALNAFEIAFDGRLSAGRK